MITIGDVKDQVEQFITDTLDARSLAEKCRDYHDHKQWTEAEAEKLRKRGQAPIVSNRVRPKVKGLVGLYNVRKTDPKAYPRTKKHEQSAHAITDALRYVADNNQFHMLRLDVAEEFFIEGYGGVMVDAKPKRGEIEIQLQRIPWDRIYFDPHSRRKDFADAKYKGFYLWGYRDDIQAMFPKVDLDAIGTADYTDETTEDRPRWVDARTNRIRIAYHWCVHKGQWYFCIFSGDTFLMKPQVSPYLDEDGEPTCPLEYVCANIDRDNNRYGEVAGFLDQQDEVNHRRSKALHYLNARQTFSAKGAVADSAKLKRELAKPDGHVEVPGGTEWMKDFGIIPTGNQLQGQFELYQEAKAELDSVSFNAQLAGERQQGDLSGRAIEKLQMAGTIELNQDYAQLANWENRVYRQCWGRIKQFWTEEKWIRITDDYDSLRWVGLNGQITMREQLEGWINDESLPIPDRRKYSAVYMQAIQAEAQTEDMALAEQASQFLEQFVAVRNPVPEIDVDIIIDQSFDVMNAQEETLQALIQFAQGSQDVDILDLIELSNLRNKEELIEKIEKRRQAAAQAAGNAADLEAQGKQAQVFKMAAEADAAQAKADQTKIENQLLIAAPRPVTSVAV